MNLVETIEYIQLPGYPLEKQTSGSPFMFFIFAGHGLGLAVGHGEGVRLLSQLLAFLLTH